MWQIGSVFTLEEVFYYLTSQKHRAGTGSQVGGLNPIVCCFASSWSGVSGSFPDRQATWWATQAAAEHGTGESPRSAILDWGALLQSAWWLTCQLVETRVFSPS